MPPKPQLKKNKCGCSSPSSSSRTLSKYGKNPAKWIPTLALTALISLPTAAAYPNIPPPLAATDIPLTEAGVAAILAYMAKFASDAALDVKAYLGFSSSSDGHPGQWMSTAVQSQPDIFAAYLKGTAPAIITDAWNNKDHDAMFTANAPFTTGAQRKAVLALWKRIWAGKEALLSVEKTILVTGQRLAEALTAIKSIRDRFPGMTQQEAWHAAHRIIDVNWDPLFEKFPQSTPE